MSASVTASRGAEDPESDRLDLIFGFFAALSEGRYADARKLVAPNATWWVLHKRGNVDPALWFSGFEAVFPEGLEFAVEGTTIEGSRIAVRAVGRGTTASGREFDNAYHFLFETSVEGISAVWEYGDTAHAERVLRT